MAEKAEKISVVVIDPDDKSRQSLKTLLKGVQRVKIAAETSDLNRGFEKIGELKPNIVMLDLSPNAEQALKMAERITQSFPHSTLFVTSFQIVPEIIIKAMRAGAREFLFKPLNRDELVNAIKSAARAQGQRSAEVNYGAKILSVFGAKGGVGTTTIATNLAVSLAQHTKKAVLLIDLNLQFGNAALFLNVQPEYSIVDLANHLNDVEPELLKNVLSKHASGAWLLSGPARIEEAEAITVSHLDQIMAILKSVFDYIVIDTKNSFDDLTLKALDESDAVLTVFTADLPGIFNARRCLEVFQRMDYNQEKVLLVLNRDGANNGGIDVDGLEKSLNYPIYWRVPNHDYTNVINSINQGIPITTGSPRAKIAVSLNDLAHCFNGVAAAPIIEVPEKVSKRSLLKNLFVKAQRSE